MRTDTALQVCGPGPIAELLAEGAPFWRSWTEMLRRAKCVALPCNSDGPTSSRREPPVRARVLSPEQRRGPSWQRFVLLAYGGSRARLPAAPSASRRRGASTHFSADSSIVNVLGASTEDLQALGLVLLRGHRAGRAALVQQRRAFHKRLRSTESRPISGSARLSRFTRIPAERWWCLCRVRASRSSRVQRQQGRTFNASGPLRPWPMSNSTS